MNHPHFLLATVVLLLAPASPAMDSVATENAASVFLEFILGAEHACFEFTKSAVESNGWTPEECSDILLLAESRLRGSSDGLDVYRRRNALGMIGDFGGTNALPELARLVNSQELDIREEAAIAFLHVSKATPEQMAPLKNALSLPVSHGRNLAQIIYQRIDFDLTYDGPPPVYQRNLLRFLLDQTAVEQGERAMLDEILCREVPKWRASPQRLANAEKMIRDHSDDAGAVAFFEGVKTDALSAAETVRGQNPDDGAPGSPANTRNQSADSPANDTDPWADLLEGLPEKKPWTPPDEYVPAS